jgi:hypothetical protein
MRSVRGRLIEFWNEYRDGVGNDCADVGERVDYGHACGVSIFERYAERAFVIHTHFSGVSGEFCATHEWPDGMGSRSFDRALEGAKAALRERVSHGMEKAVLVPIGQKAEKSEWLDARSLPYVMRLQPLDDCLRRARATKNREATVGLLHKDRKLDLVGARAAFPGRLFERVPHKLIGEVIKGRTVVLNAVADHYADAGIGRRQFLEDDGSLAGVVITLKSQGVEWSFGDRFHESAHLFEMLSRPFDLEEDTF